MDCNYPTYMFKGLFLFVFLLAEPVFAMPACSYLFAMDSRAFEPIKKEIENIISENYRFTSENKAQINAENFRKRVFELERKARRLKTNQLISMIDASLAIEHGTKGYLAGLDFSLKDIKTIKQLIEDSGRRFTFEEYWNSLPLSIREGLSKEDYSGLDANSRTTHWKNFLGNILFTTTILILKDPLEVGFLDTHVEKTEYNHIAIFVLHKVLIERIISNPDMISELGANVQDPDLFLKNIKALESLFEY